MHGCGIGRVEAARRVDEAARRVGETGGEDRGNARGRKTANFLVESVVGRPLK